MPFTQHLMPYLPYYLLAMRNALLWVPLWLVLKVTYLVPTITHHPRSHPMVMERSDSGYRRPSAYLRGSRGWSGVTHVRGPIRRGWADLPPLPPRSPHECLQALPMAA